MLLLLRATICVYFSFFVVVECVDRRTMVNNFFFCVENIYINHDQSVECVVPWDKKCAYYKRWVSNLSLSLTIFQ